MSAVLKYRYRPNIRRMALGLLGAVILCAIAFYKALHNEKVLNLYGYILTPEQSDNFFCGLAGLCGVFTCLALGSFFLSLRREHYIELTNTTLSAPKRLSSSHPTLVPLSEISSVKAFRYRGQSFITVRYLGGVLNISSTYLPQNKDFDTLYATLSSLVTPPIEHTKA